MVRSHETIDQMEKPIVRVLEPEWPDIQNRSYHFGKTHNVECGNLYNEHLQ